MAVSRELVPIVRQHVPPARLMAILARAAVALLFILVLPTVAARSSEEPQDRRRFGRDLDLDQLAQLTLEELMAIDIVSISGVPQAWFGSPAAVHVITGEEVRRSGHRSLAEALRLAPGLFVGRSGSHSWTISPRGFSGGLANKTLVLIDGREVYDPLHGGTFWDVQDILLEDLDRIEVIRGPGPTLWGANAVNGVINVITKSAAQTQGSYAMAGAGTYHELFGGARHGAELGERGWWRASAKYSSLGALDAPGPTRGHDDWDLAHASFRADVERSDSLTYTLDTKAYRSFRLGQEIRVPIPAPAPMFMPLVADGQVSGGHLLGRAQRVTGDGDGWTLQAYYDRTERRQTLFEVERDTFDLDLRRFFDAGANHALLWGVGYRHSRDDTRNGPIVALDPGSRTLQTWSGFLQDTITLSPARWFAMIGSKLEHNDHTGVELQPSARVWFTPDDRQILWAAVSRPVRVPSRLEGDGRLTLFFADEGFLEGMPTGAIVPFDVVGDPDLESEEVLIWELGYRRRPRPDLTFDVALFHNDYDNLIFVPMGLVGSFTNAGSAETYGGEAALTWQAADGWRLGGSYSYTEVRIQGPIDRQDEGNTPQHMAQLRSDLSLSERIGLNCGLYYVDRRPNNDAEAHLRLDIGLAWRPRPDLELSLWGQNLLEESHREASPILEVERGGYVSASFRF